MNSPKRVPEVVDIVVSGLSATLASHGLIDEYRLCIVPVVLGRGNPLFKDRPERMRMTLAEARPLTSGGVILTYRPETRRPDPGVA